MSVIAPAVLSPAPPSRLVRATEAIGGRCLSQAGEEMACTFEDASIVEMRVIGPGTLKKGELLVCYLDDVGLVPARIMGESPFGGFLLRPIIAADRKERISSRLAWHVERAQERAEQREAARIVPLNRRVVIQLGERLSFRGTIQNVSKTGAAITLNQACIPYVGSPVRVGRREAVVARVTADGLAVRFVTPIPAAVFDERIIL